MNWNAPSDKRVIYNRRWTLESHRMSILILPLVLLGNLFASKLVLDFGSNFECGYMCQKKLAKALPDMIIHAEQKLAAIERSKTSRERRSAHGKKLCEAKIFE